MSEAVQDKVRESYAATLHRQHLEEVLVTGQVNDADVHAANRHVLNEAAAERALLLVLLEDKREAVAQLRDQHVVDDDVARRMHAAVDAEEVRLLGVDADE